MRRAFLIALGFCLMVVVGSFIVAEPPSERLIAQRARETELAQALVVRAVRSLPAHPKWIGVRLEKGEANRFSLDLEYSVPPQSLAEAEADAKVVARAVLAELVKEGRHPSQEMTDLYVWTERKVRGETGEPLVASYGYVAYNPINDRLEYQPPKRR